MTHKFHSFLYSSNCLCVLSSERSQHVLPRPTAASTAGQFLSLILMSHLFSNSSHPEEEVSSFCEVSTGTVETLLAQ